LGKEGHNMIANIKDTTANSRVALYARVSTADKGQDPELQLVPLRDYCKARGWTVSGEFTDKGISGTKDRRPQLDELMNLARKRQIDCVVVWKLDRWGRSLKHLINSISELQSIGVSFVSYSENIDMSTPAGKMMFHVIGAMSEFERSLIVERVRAGMALAKVKGKAIGRKPTSAASLEKILSIAEDDKLSVREIAKKACMPRSTVFRTIKLFKDGQISREGVTH
jgi:DNA invertase Pin-like site-specific DNA recombinase